MPEMEGLRVTPCLPPSWERCSIRKVFRGAVYEIDYENHGTQITEILVNSEVISGNLLPWKCGETYHVTVKTS